MIIDIKFASKNHIKTTFFPMDDNSSINRYFLEIQNCFENILKCKIFKFSKTVKFTHENL